MSLKRALLWCGVIGPIFFPVAYPVEGATRAGYDPMRDLSLTVGLAWVVAIALLECRRTFRP